MSVILILYSYKKLDQFWNFLMNICHFFSSKRICREIVLFPKLLCSLSQTSYCQISYGALNLPRQIIFYLPENHISIWKSYRWYYISHILRVSSCGIYFYYIFKITLEKCNIDITNFATDQDNPFCGTIFLWC